MREVNGKGGGGGRSEKINDSYRFGRRNKIQAQFTPTTAECQQKACDILTL